MKLHRLRAGSHAGQGFTLIEVIISMLLLGLISLCLTTAFSFAITNTARAGARRQGMAATETSIGRVEGGADHLSSANIGGRQFDVTSSSSGHTVVVVLAGGSTKHDVSGSMIAITATEERDISAPLSVFMPSSVGEEYH